MHSVKVVFHIDELDKWPLLLANVRNLVKVTEAITSHIVVLANSKAVSVFDDSTQPNHIDAITELSVSGVAFEFCRNSLHGLNIREERLPDFIKVIPVGVLALIEKQAAGFAYIKP